MKSQAANLLGCIFESLSQIVQFISKLPVFIWDAWILQKFKDKKIVKRNGILLYVSVQNVETNCEVWENIEPTSFINVFLSSNKFCNWAWSSFMVCSQLYI